MADRIICELCGRVHETGDHDEATAGGWVLNWDGWVCSAHDQSEAA